MIVAVGENGVRLQDAEDVKGFHVAVRDGAHADAELRGSGAGWVAVDGDARIAVDWVRGAAVAAGVGSTWTYSFAGMLDHARDKGWLDAEGTVIRAHVEHVS